MKTNAQTLFYSLLIVAVMASTGGCATEKSQAELLAKARITQTQASVTALGQVPGGAVKSSELEEEDGRLVWSFDITGPGADAVTEVLVDALTGEVVSVEKETPAQEREEAREKRSRDPGKSEAIADTAWTETLVPVQEPLSTTGRNRYFILEPGYQLVLEGREERRAVQLIITVLDEVKTVAGFETRVVEERETADGQLVEVSRNYCAIGAESHNAYYFGEDVDEYKAGQVAHGGAWLAGVGGATFGVLLPGDVKIGARYYQEKAPQLAMDRAENVSSSVTFSAPAGRFTHCLKVKETTPLEPGNVEYKLYAPDVGLVQDGSLRLVRYGFVRK